MTTDFDVKTDIFSRNLSVNCIDFKKELTLLNNSLLSHSQKFVFCVSVKLSNRNLDDF